jgi:hypothetical protein
VGRQASFEEEVGLGLNPEELAATIEALYDLVLDRLLRTVRPSPHWKDLNWQTVQAILDSSANAYAKAVMTFREHFEHVAAPGFLPGFELDEEVWTALAEVTKAPGWPAMRLHSDHPVASCALCTLLDKTRLARPYG